MERQARGHKRETSKPRPPYNRQKEGPVLPEKQDETFGEFYKAARFNNILDQKTTLMVHLATAMSAACYP